TREKMLDGPVLSTLLRLAIPNIVVVVVQATSSAVDAFWLGRLGSEVLAGVALVFPTWMLMVTMSAGGVGGGISSSIARAVGELLHLALAPALIFGLGPIPALGVSGAGMSLVTSYALRAAALGGYLLARRAGVSLSIGRLRLQRSMFWEILRVGLPGSLNTV